jgi:DNA-binding response OmpR family regulator
MKILVVDDDHLILEILKQTLSLSGFTDVTVAQSAVEASQIIAVASPAFECFLFDMKMPEIEGDDLCYWVRQLPQHASTPIVMVTALENKLDIDRAFAAGASDYITKPINISDFGSRMKQIERKIMQGEFRAPTGLHLVGQRQRKVDRVELSKAMHLGGINGEIDLKSLEKYLFQLSRTGIQGLSAFAFSIMDVAKFHFVCSTGEYTDILRLTGEMISKHLVDPGFFLSYSGSGAFVGVVQKIDFGEIEWKMIEENVQASLETIAIPARSGLPMRVKTRSGLPLQLSGKSGEKSTDVLYRAAVEAEELCRPFFAVA